VLSSSDVPEIDAGPVDRNELIAIFGERNGANQSDLFEGVCLSERLMEIEDEENQGGSYLDIPAFRLIPEWV
jgi:hypothetical protein